MKNTFIVCDISRQIAKVSERIELLSNGMEAIEQNADSDVAGTYEEMRLQELEHLQCLTLEITRFIAGNSDSEEAENTDDGEGSAFSEGKLTRNLEDKTKNKGEKDE